MGDYWLDKLKDALAGPNKPIVVCGAGVAVAATEGSAPNWPQLVTSGINHAEKIDPSQRKWAEFSRERLTKDDPGEWIAAADDLTKRLGGQSNAEFAAWIKQEVSSLTPTDPSLLDAIAALGCPIATTNYDDLLSRRLGRHVINWTDYDETARFLKGESDGILHLHGHWRSPRTIVLGTRSYDDLNGDGRRTFLSQLTGLMRPSILVGCGAGLEDPDFAQLDMFLRQWQAVAEPRFWLMRSPNAGPAGMPTPNAERRLYPVGFGTSFRDLAPFLTSLAMNTPSSHSSNTFKNIEHHEPNPTIFGRGREIAALVDNILSGSSVVIAGGPGFGKTALAVSVAYDTRIAEAFDDRRAFVSLEGDSEPRAILARILGVWGLAAVGDESSLIRQIQMAVSNTKTLIILDNAETVFASDRVEAERLAKLLVQLSNLQIILTIRGSAPLIPGAHTLHDLHKLDPDAAKNAFLAIAGSALGSDIWLDKLLNALDGHALSIQLMGAQAMGSTNLALLYEAWEDLHAEILKRPDASEGRLTSVRASLSLSLKGPELERHIMARRLLAILAYLPAGIEPGKVTRLLGERGGVSKTKAFAAVNVLKRFKLVESRLDDRLRMLTPLRECIKLDVPITRKDRERLFSYYLGLAEKSSAAGKPNWLLVKESVESEADNLDSICELAIPYDRSTDDHLVDAMCGLADLARHTGMAGITSLEKAAPYYKENGHYEKSAEIEAKIAVVKYDRGDFETAENLFHSSLDLSEARGYKIPLINSLIGLGQIHKAFSENDVARGYFERALSLSIASHARVGRSTCEHAIAQMASRNPDPKPARALLHAAIASAREAGDVLGEANSLLDLALIEDDLDIEELKRIHNIYESYGTSAPQMVCLVDIGYAYMGRGELGEALKYIKQALELARKVVDGRYEAHVLLRHGTWKKLAGEPDARDVIEGALARLVDTVFDRDLAKQGWLNLQAEISESYKTGKPIVLEECTAMWRSIDRCDLVRFWATPGWY